MCNRCARPYTNLVISSAAWFDDVPNSKLYRTNLKDAYIFDGYDHDLSPKPVIINRLYNLLAHTLFLYRLRPKFLYAL